MSQVGNPQRRYRGLVLPQLLRPGLRLVVLGAEGCRTSMMRSVHQINEDQYLIRTCNSRYALHIARSGAARELGGPGDRTNSAVPGAE